jgi:hypothetical protein
VCQFYFSLLLNISFAQLGVKPDIHSHSANSQNIVTLEDERGALSSLYNWNQLQWLGFGLPVGPEAFNRDQTLGLRSVIPLLSALNCQG